MAGDGSRHERNEIPRGRWPAGLAGMFVAVLAVEAVFSGAVRFESLAPAGWRSDRMSAETEPATSAEILCLGDSLVKTGVIPAALEARLDRTAYNLAAFGNPTPATYFLFRRALATGALPRAIVLDASETQLRSEYRPCVAAWAGLIGPPEALRLAIDDRDMGFLGLFLVHYLLPSVRLRQDARAAIRALFDGPPPEGTTHWPRVLDRQRKRNGGAMLFPPLNAESNVGIGAGPPAGAGDFLDPATPVGSATNLLYLDRILALARSRGIRVFLVVPPVRPDVLAVRERLGPEARYLGLLSGLRDRYENVVVVDGRRTVADRDVFFDARHMDFRGATVFSAALAEAMAPWLEGIPQPGRWVTPPPFDGPSARLAVETMDESRWAVAWQTMATGGSTR